MLDLTSSAPTGPPIGTMRCTCHTLRAGVVRVALSGGLDLNAGQELGRLIVRLLGDSSRVIVDLDELAFVDPAGAAALRAAGRRAGSRVVGVNVNPHVRTTLMTAGVHRALKLVDTTPAVVVDDQAA